MNWPEAFSLVGSLFAVAWIFVSLFKAMGRSDDNE